MNPALQSLAFDTLAVFRNYSLRVGGLEVLREVGAPGNRYGVDPASIGLTHAAPGEVSALSFTITDPLGVIGLSTGMVEYIDNAQNVTLFLGFIDSWQPSPYGLGRTIEVSCKGVESVLDWMQVTAPVVWAAGADVIALVQRVAGQAMGVGFSLNTASLPGSLSTTAYPVTGLSFGACLMSAAGTAGPGTLRAVLQTILDSTDLGSALGTGPRTYSQLQVSVGFYGDLRVWAILYPFSQTDYQEAVIVESFTPTIAARRSSNLQHRTIPGDATRGVYVQGGNAAGSGAFPDGSGVIGPWAVLNDSNSLTPAYAQALASSYLSRHGIPLSGSVDRDMGNQVMGGPGVQQMTIPGATFVDLTDPQIGLVSYRALVASIDKAFGNVHQEAWHYTYGQVQSGAAYLRQLTRAVIE